MANDADLKQRKCTFLVSNKARLKLLCTAAGVVILGNRLMTFLLFHVELGALVMLGITICSQFSELALKIGKALVARKILVYLGRRVFHLSHVRIFNIIKKSESEP